MVADLAEVEGSVGSHDEAVWVVDLSLRGWAAIAGITPDAITRHRGNDPAWGDLADAVVALIRHE